MLFQSCCSSQGCAITQSGCGQGVFPYTHRSSDPLGFIYFISTFQLPFPSPLIKVCWEQTRGLFCCCLLCYVFKGSLANTQHYVVRCSGSSKVRNALLLWAVSSCGHAREMRQPHPALFQLSVRPTERLLLTPASAGSTTVVRAGLQYSE